MDDLDSIVKASVGEILRAFERKYALEIDGNFLSFIFWIYEKFQVIFKNINVIYYVKGYWRYVDLEYLLQLYEAINLQAGIYLGNFEVIKLSEISKIINDYGFPDFLIRHCLSMLSESKHENELGEINYMHFL